MMLEERHKETEMTLTCKDFQRRIANTSITPSALRNQGAKGIIKEAREFLAQTEIELFAQALDESSFQVELERINWAIRLRPLRWPRSRSSIRTRGLP